MKICKSLILFLLIINAISVFSQTQTAGSFNSNLNVKDVKAVLKAVADWQIRTPLTHEPADWTNAALYAGMVEWAGIAGNNSYYEWLKDICTKTSWSYLVRSEPLGKYHADDYFQVWK